MASPTQLTKKPLSVQPRNLRSYLWNDAEVQVQRFSRGSAEVQQRFSRGSAEVLQQRFSRGSEEVQQRFSSGAEVQRCRYRYGGAEVLRC
jgi:hypothetical protein